MIGIHAGASSRTHVTRPGPASKRRAPNWRMACSQAGAGGWASITATSRLCPPRHAGRWRRSRRRGWNTDQAAGFVFDMKNLQHFDGPTFEADVLHATEPVVVDFYADWCHPCHMMGPVVEQLAGEFAGKVKIGKLDVDANQEIAIRYGVMGIPTLGLFRDGKLVDRMVGYPGGPAPIRERTETTAHVDTARNYTAGVRMRGHRDRSLSSRARLRRRRR